VDIGVHQDGLVHISMLSNRFVKDPHEVVKPGQIVKVKVLEVDLKRQRIALTMRLDDVPGAAQQRGGVRQVATGSERVRPVTDQRRAGSRDSRLKADVQPASAMALAFAKLKK
jgi:uncharacterized protein